MAYGKINKTKKEEHKKSNNNCGIAYAAWGFVCNQPQAS